MKLTVSPEVRTKLGLPATATATQIVDALERHVRAETQKAKTRPLRAVDDADALYLSLYGATH